MAVWSWLSLSPSSAAVAAGDERARLLGTDIMFDTDFHVGADGDYVLLQGIEALKQAIYHRLITRPGEYKLRPEYGVGVLSYVKKRNRPADLAELRARIVDQLMQDRRIDEVLGVAVENLEDAPGVTITIAVRAAGQELQFLPLTLTDDAPGLSPRA